MTIFAVPANPNISVKMVPQNKMSGECWSIQIWGPIRCTDCEYKDTDECGGKEIRKTGRNEKGYEVPLGEEQ